MGEDSSGSSTPAPEIKTVSPAVKPAVVPAGESEIELKLAKLTVRVEELENENLQHREHIMLLEKGLMLGVVPEELKRKEWKLAKKGKKEGAEADSVLSDKGDGSAARKPESSEAALLPVKSKDVAEYRRLVQQAQAKFNSANYGQAIAIFNDIGEKFDDSLTEGSQYYWVGLGWYYLKENQLSEQSLSTLKERFPQNKWVPYARFYLAKIDQTRGLHNKALDQMRTLLEEFPNQDIGEMARQEVQKMRENL